MDYNKGDLVLVANADTTSTCIIITELFATSEDANFYYTYCLETGLYGIVYDEEVSCLVSKGFAPDFQSDCDLFDDNFSFYEKLFDAFGWFPNNYGSGSHP